MAQYKMPNLILQNELRPCYVNGKKALFHRWIDIEQPIIKINCLCGIETRNKILKQYHQFQTLPSDAELSKVKQTYGIVEYENGEVTEVDPCKIRFADDKIKEYAF